LLKKKSREVFKVSHTDSAIFEYYLKKLSKLYKNKLIELGILDSIVEFSNYANGLLNSIFTAKNVIAEISSKKKCSALCLDIKDCFNSVSHKSILEIARKHILPKSTN